MWKHIIDFAKDLLLLNREIEQNKSDIKEIRQEIRDVRGEVREIRGEVRQIREDFNKLVHIVKQLSSDINDVSKREEAERKNLALQLENEMLKFERRLPHGKDLEK